MSNDTLRAFHPVPRGLYRDRRFRQLGPLAKVLLLEGHMFADDTESNGLLSESDMLVLAGFAGISAMGIGGVVQELLDSTLLGAPSADGHYALADFRGLSHEAHERNRAKGRAKMKKARTRQRGYNKYPGNDPGEQPLGTAPGGDHAHRN